MSDERDPKAKFREALEKKKISGKSGPNGSGGPSKIKGGQAGANAPKMFRRKSGSS